MADLRFIVERLDQRLREFLESFTELVVRLEAAQQPKEPSPLEAARNALLEHHGDQARLEATRKAEGSDNLDNAIDLNHRLIIGDQARVAFLEAEEDKSNAD